VPKDEKTLADLAERSSVHPNQITSWNSETQKSAAIVFNGSRVSPKPRVDLKIPYAKGGRLTPEYGFSLTGK
jgi:hypothetical protein